jgi:hypothetical protein
MEIDVRSGSSGKVDSVRVCDPSKELALADTIYREEGGGACFFDSDSHEDYLMIQNKEHAENLILGLKKVIELGWCK